MKAVIQVVGQAEVKVDGELISKIGKGLVVFFCVERDDEESKLAYFAKKVANLRIFEDENGKTNLSVKVTSFGKSSLSELSVVRRNAMSGRGRAFSTKVSRHSMFSDEGRFKNLLRAG